MKQEDQYTNIYLTDMQFHTAELRNPPSWWRAILKNIRSNKPTRAYTKNFSMEKQRDGTFMFRFQFTAPDELAKQISELEKKTGKKVRVMLPLNQLFKISLGKDAVEFLKGRENKNWKKVDKYIS